MTRHSLLLLAASLIASPLVAQRSAASLSPFGRRLTIEYATGGMAGGPANGLVSELRAAGYDSTAPGGCFLYLICGGPTGTPYTRTAKGTLVSFSARYALRRTFSVGAGYERGSIGGATGLGTNGYLTSDWSVKTYWAAAYWVPTRGFRLGVGPAWHTLTDRADRPTIHKFGVSGEAGLQFPRERLFFIDIATRYHLIPTEEVEIGDPNSAAVMTSRPKWSHLAIGLGLGLRI